jgi:hypothetical protein
LLLNASAKICPRGRRSGGQAQWRRCDLVAVRCLLPSWLLAAHRRCSLVASPPAPSPNPPPHPNLLTDSRRNHRIMQINEHLGVFCLGSGGAAWPWQMDNVADKYASWHAPYHKQELTTIHNTLFWGGGWPLPAWKNKYLRRQINAGKAAVVGYHTGGFGQQCVSPDIHAHDRDPNSSSPPPPLLQLRCREAVQVETLRSVLLRVMRDAVQVREESARVDTLGATNSPSLRAGTSTTSTTGGGRGVTTGTA